MASDEAFGLCGYLKAIASWHDCKMAGALPKSEAPAVMPALRPMLKSEAPIHSDNDGADVFEPSESSDDEESVPSPAKKQRITRSSARIRS
jgi:hypothetical protein